MDLVTVGWIALGWFAVALVVSLALGGFLRKASIVLDEDELALVSTRQKAMRFMRGHKPAVGQRNKVVSRMQVQGSRATG